MSKWNAGRIIGYSVIAVSLFTLGRCTYNDFDNDSLRHHNRKKPNTSINVDGIYVEADKVQINIQNKAIDSYNRNNSNNNGTRSNNNGNSSNSSGTNAKIRDLEMRLRVEELKSEKAEKECYDEKAEKECYDEPQKHTHTKKVVVYVGNRGKASQTVENCIEAYQNVNNPNIILTPTGITNRNTETFLENNNGNLRYVRIDKRRDNVYSWPRAAGVTSALDFVGNFGSSYKFNGENYTINSESPLIKGSEFANSVYK